MNPNWGDVENFLDLINNLWIGVVVILAGAIPSWLTARTHRSIKTETKVIRDQLVNGHTSPMRADLDKALAAIESLASDVTALRHDLLLERDSRKAQVEDLRSDVDRMRRR